MKIQQKFFLIQCVFSLVLLTTLVLLIQWSIRNGMVDYINTKEIESLTPVVNALSKVYESSGNWSELEGKREIFLQLIRSTLSGEEFNIKAVNSRRNGPPPPRHRQRRPPPPERFLSDDDSRNLPPHKSSPPLGAQEVSYVLFDTNNRFIVGRYNEDLTYNKISISVGKEVVGSFWVVKRNNLAEGYELDYIEKQQEYLWVIAVVMMLLVVLITFPLARHVVEPIKLIAHGMNRLTQGDYTKTIDSCRNDEFGELSRDYNELAFTLAENEDARKRWLANISHELRTPVAILRLELEAMLDGIRPLTQKNIASACDELNHLAKLIDDLHQLTIADVAGMQYSKQDVNLTQLLTSEESKFNSYLADTNVTLMLDLVQKPIQVYADKTRLLQLFENLLNNIVKYAEASSVKVSTRVINRDSNEFVELIFEDNGLGVDDEHLERLFEYLYRTDDSRNRKTGGSGLGLSICYNIVMAHQGKIFATKSNLGGLAINIELPLGQLA